MEHKLIDISLITPDSEQPRKIFDQEELKALAKSIITHGLLQSIVVREAPDNSKKYIIVAGERRYRACLMAGLKELDCNVISKGQYKEIALIENLQRVDLNPLEEAEAIKKLMSLKRYTQEQVARVLGKTRSYVSNRVRLLNLPENVKEALKEGLSEGHGRVILSLKSKPQQEQLLKEIKENNLNVKETQKKAKEIEKTNVKKVKVPKYNKKAEKKQKDKYIEKAIEELEENLGTKVTLKQGRNMGKIEIEYYNKEDLQNLLERLLNS